VYFAAGPGLSAWLGAVVQTVATHAGLPAKALPLLRWAVDAGIVGLGAGGGLLVFLALLFALKLHQQEALADDSPVPTTYRYKPK